MLPGVVLVCCLPKSSKRYILLAFVIPASWGGCAYVPRHGCLMQVAEELGPDKVQILKIDTDQNPEISSQLQVQLVSALLCPLT